MKKKNEFQDSINLLLTSYQKMKFLQNSSYVNFGHLNPSIFFGLYCRWWIKQVAK